MAFLMGLALLISLSVVSYRSLSELTRTADQVTDSLRVITQLEETLSDFKDIAIGYRSYVLTGKESYLDVYRQARQDMDFNFRELRNMTADDPRQRQRLDELEQLKQRSFDRSEEIVRTRRTQGVNETLILLERDAGQTPATEIRQVIKEMEAEEAHLLQLHEAAARASARRATTVLLMGSSIGALLTGLAILAVRRGLERRKRADALLRRLNIELERRVAERTAELSAATRRLKFALDGARLGAWAMDLSDGRLWFDEASEVMHGVGSDDPITNIEEAGVNIHPEDRAVVLARFRGVVQSLTELECEYRVVMPDGAVRWIASRGQVAYSDKDEPQPFKMFGIMQDVTERKQAEAEREQLLGAEQAARQTAEEANRMKDEFLAVLSHELRSPLNAIVGYANMMRGGRHKPEETPRVLEIILRNARAQQQLIEDLLDVSGAITGKMGLNLGTVEPEMVVQKALDTVRSAAAAKQITLDTTSDPAVGVISGDADRLQQAVWNLLSNAVKFTPAGGRVTVRLARVDHYVEIAVSDTGKGINPEYLPHVFDRFSQEDYSTTRRYGGLGLGLSIVRHITELHGGTAHVASDGEGRGATFTIRLPLTAGLMAQPQTENSHETAGFPPREMESELDGARVLVVDDDLDTRQLLKQIMENHGAEVRTAASAAEALEMISAAPPDAVVADIGMPGEDGYSLMRKIRNLPPDRGGGVPALALTAYARPEDRVRAMTAGFQYYVTKPVEPDELAAVVANLTVRLNDPLPL
jgi:signal transduction histidine kinase/CHASE3 domain sensor protein/ActR/RegA family two-component response regulator